MKQKLVSLFNNNPMIRRTCLLLYFTILVLFAMIDLRFGVAILLLPVLIFWIINGKSGFAKLGDWVEMYDWAWIVPLGLAFFWLTGYILQDVLRLSSGTYDFTFLQPFFLSLVITMLMFAGSSLLLRFNWTSLFKYWFCDDCDQQELNLWNDLKNIEPWKRLLYLYLVLFSYVVVTLIVYTALV